MSVPNIPRSPKWTIADDPKQTLMILPAKQPGDERESHAFPIEKWFNAITVAESLPRKFCTHSCPRAITLSGYEGSARVVATMKVLSCSGAVPANTRSFYFSSRREAHTPAQRNVNMSYKTTTKDTMFGEEYDGEDPDEICREYLRAKKVRTKKKRESSRATSRGKGGK